MRVLISCEFSGEVREAFIKKGHKAVSCDLIDTLIPGPHYKGDVRDIINDGWDLMIAHPPCTHLAVSGARWFKEKIEDGRQQAALDFVKFHMDADIEKIVIENPVSIISSQIRKPDQIIQPHQFGHPVNKKTCLWLKGVKPLIPTKKLIIPKRGTDEWKSWNVIHNMGPSEDRAMKRSITFTGIAQAMAQQWG